MTDMYSEYLALVENRLGQLFTEGDQYDRLNDSMRYSLLAGGKRIRPVLALAFCQACGGDIQKALDAACALELLHTYSLIHDDLPCMDNDNLRRGKPTNHVVYGETTAVLAGDCLQAEAFSLLLSCQLPASSLALMAQSLARAAGLNGICGGQALDIAGEGKTLTAQELTRIHSGKTASLLIACAEIGVYAAGGSEAQLQAAREYAADIGLAFQIQDDILDVTASEAELGKPIGSDAANRKCTYVTLFGPENCQKLVEEKTNSACRALAEAFPETEFLSSLAHRLASRKK